MPDANRRGTQPPLVSFLGEVQVPSSPTHPAVDLFLAGCEYLIQFLSVLTARDAILSENIRDASAALALMLISVALFCFESAMTLDDEGAMGANASKLCRRAFLGMIVGGVTDFLLLVLSTVLVLPEGLWPVAWFICLIATLVTPNWCLRYRYSKFKESREDRRA